MAMILRPDPEDKHALEMLTDADGVSRQVAVIRAIHEAASRRFRDGKIRTLSTSCRKRYADLLDRLGK